MGCGKGSKWCKVTHIVTGRQNGTQIRDGCKMGLKNDMPTTWNAAHHRNATRQTVMSTIFAALAVALGLQC
jgi:hypothetical protein